MRHVADALLQFNFKLQLEALHRSVRTLQFGLMIGESQLEDSPSMRR